MDVAVLTDTGKHMPGHIRLVLELPAAAGGERVIERVTADVKVHSPRVVVDHDIVTEQVDVAVDGRGRPGGCSSSTVITAMSTARPRRPCPCASPPRSPEHHPHASVHASTVGGARCNVHGESQGSEDVRASAWASSSEAVVCSALASATRLLTPMLYAPRSIPLR